MQSYLYLENKFKLYDIGDHSVREIMLGPYMIRFECKGFPVALYFAGDDDKLWARLICEGKWVRPMCKFIDEMVDYLRYIGEDYSAVISTMKFKDVQQKVLEKRNHFHSTSKFIDLEEYKVDNSID